MENVINKYGMTDYGYLNKKFNEIGKFLLGWTKSILSTEITKNILNCFKDKEEYNYFKNLAHSNGLNNSIFYIGELIIDIHFYNLIHSQWMFNTLIEYYWYNDMSKILGKEYNELNIKYKLVCNLIISLNPNYNI